MSIRGRAIIIYIVFFGLLRKTVRGYHHPELCIPRELDNCTAAPFQPGNSSFIRDVHPDLHVTRTAGKIKILPLGDSLTKGQVFMKCDALSRDAGTTTGLCDGSTSYRYFLGLHLQVRVHPLKSPMTFRETKNFQPRSVRRFGDICPSSSSAPGPPSHVKRLQEPAQVAQPAQTHFRAPPATIPGIR
eukprot:9473595-Pyramimonas_sp.AAC.1